MSGANPRIRPFPATTIGELAGRKYDGVLATLGFEQRSRELPAALITPERVAVPFRDRHEAAFGDNKEWFDQHDWRQPPLDEADYYAWVDRWLKDRLAERGTATRLAIDVSSTSRARMAAVIEAILNLPTDAGVEVDFLYTPAVFEEPSTQDEPPVFSVAPVSAYFAGWWDALDTPLHAIIGLGYELEHASSAINMLEPESTEVYIASGSDPRYEPAVRDANRALGTTKGVSRIETMYDVRDPFSCFRQLEASITRLSKGRRVALVPLGPKIFAVCAILAAGLHLDEVQVIRVSAGQRQKAVDRRSDGQVYGLTLAITPSRPSDDIDEEGGSQPGTGGADT